MLNVLLQQLQDVFETNNYLVTNKKEFIDNAKKIGISELRAKTIYINEMKRLSQRMTDLDNQIADWNCSTK